MRSRQILVSLIIIAGAIVSARLGSAVSADDQAPELEAPISSPAPVASIPPPSPASSSAASASRNPQAPMSRSNREAASASRPSAVLAVPGLDGNIPAPRRLPVPSFERVAPARSPELSAPLDLKDADESSNLPLELETDRPGYGGNLDPSRSFTNPSSPRNSNDPAPRNRTGAPSQTRPRSTDPRASNLSRNSSVKVTDPPPRRGFFGFFRPQPPVRDASPIDRRPSVVSDPVIDRNDGVIAVEPPRSDPATDDALKRRIERQARAIGGDRLRTLDVKVKGKRVLIRATANRFWQRRSLRNDLQTLQALAGLQSQVEVVP
jgi:hypothetical protein